MFDNKYDFSLDSFIHLENLYNATQEVYSEALYSYVGLCEDVEVFK